TGSPCHQPEVLLVKHRNILFVEKKDKRRQELLERREREVPAFREFDEVLDHRIIKIQVISHQYVFFEVTNQHDALFVQLDLTRPVLMDILVHMLIANHSKSLAQRLIYSWTSASNPNDFSILNSAAYALFRSVRRGWAF